MIEGAGLRMRVALFGGSFNPPHVAHQLVALYVLETLDLDQLWFLPCFKHPFEKLLAPFEDRLRMCELAAAALGRRVMVSDVERRLGGDSRTLRTVKALQAEHPGTSFALVVGTDLEPELASWCGADELARLLPVVVVGRGDRAASGSPVVMPAISSSDIRERIARGEAIDALVPRAVLDYLKERKVYGCV